MHRNRTWQIDPTELRTQRNRILPIEGGDGSTLNLDFTTGVLDPRLTFSRASTATFVNSSGYVEWAGANTAPYSESLNVGLGYSDNALLPRSTTTSPTGNTAVVFYPTLVSDYHRLQFGGPIAMVGATTISVYVKQIGSDYRVGINSTGYIGAGAIFSLVGAGSVVGSVGGTAPNRAATITKITDDGWYRITLTGTYTTLTSTYLFMDSSTSTDYTGGPFIGVDSQGVSFWGFQINPGSTAQTYYPTTTTLYYAPRFDYSPTNIGEARGLLIEGSAINLINWSESFQITGGAFNWNFSTLNVTRGTVTTTDPTGSIATVIKIEETNANGIHAPLTLPNANASTEYTFSVYAKAAERTFVQLLENGGSSGSCMVNLSTGAIVSEFVAGSATVTPYGTTGWYRISLKFTLAVSQTAANCHIRLSTDGTTTSYTGTTGSGIYIWGAQLELGSSASSYIPTGASQVTRTTDSLTMTGTNFSSWFNSAEGTFLAEFQTLYSGLTTDANLLLLLNSDASKRIMYLNTGAESMGSFDGTTALVAVGDVTGSIAKCASTYTSTARSIVSNGGTVTTGAVVAGYSTASSLGIGLTNPKILLRKLKFYQTARPNAELKALTTL